VLQPLPPFWWCIKVTTHDEASFMGRMEIFHLLLINNIKNTWMNKKRAWSSHFLSWYLEFSVHQYFHWDSGDCHQHFWVPEVTDNIKKHAFDTQGLIPAVWKG
jgi:hypothetical protein